MNNISPISLTNEEKEIFESPHFILLKNNIIQKSQQFLYHIQQALLPITTAHEALSFIPNQTPKISKGENYQGLPYQVLDYPALFQQDDIFAFRTIIWWGNEISFCLLVKGAYKNKYQSILREKIDQLPSFSLSLASTPWEHHFESGNYVPISQLSNTVITDTFTNKNFIKIGKRYPITEWNNAYNCIVEDYKSLVSLLFSK